ncbi:MAG: phosphoadenosine phosphosulfate reductase family protein [Eubacteriales bacterium]
MVTYECEHCHIATTQSNCSVCGERTTVKSQLYWCKHCNIPTYDQICPLCQHKGDYFTSDARPVFPEERLLLEILLDKPFAFLESSVWNGVGNRYYINGKKLNTPLSVFLEKDPDKIRTFLAELSPQNSYHHFESLMQRWLEANLQHIQYISTEAKDYIQKRAKGFVGEKSAPIFVSFSAGKDSTVVSDLVQKALSTPSIIHIFGNTTLEFPYTYEYVKRFKEHNKKPPCWSLKIKSRIFLSYAKHLDLPVVPCVGVALILKQA